MIYGYARCSTNESKQDINRQIKELKAAGADEVIFEYEHGDARTKKELNLFDLELLLQIPLQIPQLLLVVADGLG